MKKILLNFPFVSRIALALILGVIALVLSGLIWKVSPFPLPFLDVVLLVLATWLMYKTDNKSLREIGLNISIRHILFLLLGTAIGIIAFGMTTYFKSLYTGEHWRFNAAVDVSLLLKGFYLILPSVAVQELMFRGYLFTKTIERTNVAKANIIFAILFMLVHVLDRNVLQQPVQIIVLAVSIPVGHLLFATGLLQTKTLFFPIGLHLGNNWAVTYLLGNAGKTHSIFYFSNPQNISSWTSFVILLFIFNASFLLVTLLIWKWKKWFVKNKS